MTKCDICRRPAELTYLASPIRLNQETEVALRLIGGKKILISDLHVCWSCFDVQCGGMTAEDLSSEAFTLASDLYAREIELSDKEKCYDELMQTSENAYDEICYAVFGRHYSYSRERGLYPNLTSLSNSFDSIIEGIKDAARAEGYEEGLEQGQHEGYDEGYKQGIKEEREITFENEDEEAEVLV